MNLNSLPQEIFARVLSHSDYVAINRMRRLDARVNAIAVSYNYGTRLPLNGSLCFSSCQVTINDEMLAIFRKHRKNILRNLHSFNSVETNVDCSKVAAKQFISSATNLQILRLDNSSTSINSFLRTSVLGKREWQSLDVGTNSLDYNFTHKHLNDRFLHKVVKNCKRGIIKFGKTSSTKITVDGIIDLIKTFQQECITGREIIISVHSKDPLHSDEEKFRNIPGILSRFDRIEHFADGDNSSETMARCQIPSPTDSDNTRFLIYIYHQLDEHPNNMEM